jgi:galactose-1-phosphate uridylyltransferase
VWCALAEAGESGERLIFADHHAVVFSPAASRSPFEMMVVPRQHASDFTAPTTGASPMRRQHLHALGAGRPAVQPLHTAPAGERLDQTFHWHWEIRSVSPASSVPPRGSEPGDAQLRKSCASG